MQRTEWGATLAFTNGHHRDFLDDQAEDDGHPAFETKLWCSPCFALYMREALDVGRQRGLVP